MFKPRYRWMGLLLAGLAALGWLGPAGPGHALAEAPVWAQVDAGLPAGLALNGVFLTDGPDGAWVAAADGSGGRVIRLQRQAGGWTSELGPAWRAPLRAVVAVSDANVWAVGDQGLILHRDGSGWHELPSPAPAASLTTIQMFGQGEEGWAGGTVTAVDQLPVPVLLHFQSGGWTRDPSIAGPGSIQSLHFAGPSGWATGQLHPPVSPAPPGVDPNASMLWHYSSGRWRLEPTPICPTGFTCNTALNAVRAVSADEAWAVGVAQPGHGPGGRGRLIAHRIAGQWQDLSRAPLAGDPSATWQTWLNGLSFSDGTHGLAVGGQSCCLFGGVVRPFAISYRPDGGWHYENLPYVAGALLAISQADATHALAVGEGSLVLSYGYGGPAPAPWPTATPVPPAVTPTPVPAPWQRHADPQLPGVLYFAPTGHSLQGGFRAYWEAHGGLAQFGYPLTEEYVETFAGQPFTTQWFERARFEWHPENRPPYDILLGSLGREMSAGRESAAPFAPAAAQANPAAVYFPATRHNLAPAFAAYWRTQGGLPVYGYPISEAFTEVSATDGKPYLVQYFERNRLEYHPAAAPPDQVVLGLLGVDLLQQRGWLP